MMKKMFKLTCFAPIEPTKLEHLLKGIHFKPVKNGLEWYMDGTIFRIEPFQNQPRESMKAYRIYFNGDIHGGTYLFDITLGCLGAEVTGIEYLLEHQDMKNEDWISDLRKRASYKLVDPRGLYSKQGIGVIVINNSITLQLRPGKNKKLKIVECLEKISVIRNELMPIDYDLFSFSKEEIA
jgi:hypothetical protein